VFLYVTVWIQKEQWLLGVGLTPYDHSHTHMAQMSSVHYLFEATLLDIASGICFYSNYKKPDTYVVISSCLQTLYISTAVTFAV